MGAHVCFRAFLTCSVRVKIVREPAKDNGSGIRRGILLLLTAFKRDSARQELRLSDYLRRFNAASESRAQPDDGVSFTARTRHTCARNNRKGQKHVSTVILTKDLTKIYEGALRGQDVHALQDLNLEIFEGEIFGYLGPNGSGKTTTIKMLLGLIFPTAGVIEILGSRAISSAAVKRNIGYLPEGAYYPDFLRGEEILSYYGKLYGLRGADLKRRIDAVLELVGMQHARKRLLRGYSKGMRQRIGLAQALISDPQILILDEPTTGLDPIVRKEIRDILLRLREEGKTLLISSHELLEVELISNRVGILYNGMLQTTGTVDELLIKREMTVDVDGVNESTMEELKARGVAIEDRTGARAKLRVSGALSVYDVIDLCKTKSLQLNSVAPRRETLEELFVRVIGAAEAARR
ncbi:MAG TPA: ABC transporter ATP-binding protein [Candidatus Hydrogenedentes bacterium]|nr:ABC transporter ATP-binding protein [Candidatus Hydrogenedentota bacterium]